MRQVKRATKQMTTKKKQKKQKTDGMTPVSFPPLSQVCLSCQHSLHLSKAQSPLSLCRYRSPSHPLSCTHSSPSSLSALSSTLEPQFTSRFGWPQHIHTHSVLFFLQLYVKDKWRKAEWKAPRVCHRSAKAAKRPKIELLKKNKNIISGASFVSYFLLGEHVPLSLLM